MRDVQRRLYISGTGVGDGLSLSDVYVVLAGIPSSYRFLCVGTYVARKIGKFGGGLGAW